MRRAARTLAAALCAAGMFGVAWTITVWVWQDPFTALYTTWQQAKLERSLDREIAAYRAPFRAETSSVREQELVAAAAARDRSELKVGQALGRIVIPRMHLSIVVVNGTDEAALEKGPGRYLGSAMPGQGQLVYIAGHRTTYLAPFAHIDALRKGDRITLELPYATFVYRVTGHRVVRADDLAVLRSHGYELLELQACHPRFFATHRYIAYAKPVEVIPTGQRAYVPSA